MLDKDKFGAVASATHYTRSIVEYAKRLTNDDWDKIEEQNNEPVLADDQRRGRRLKRRPRRS